MAESGSESGNESISVDLSVFAAEDFDIDTHKIGQGSYGIVYRAFHRHEKKWYALKLPSSSVSGNESVLKELAREVRVMAARRNEFIVAVHGLVRNANSILGLAMDYMKHGSVHDVNSSRGLSIPFPPALKLRVLYETASALLSLHSIGVLHLDVKTPNLLLDDDFHVKLTDFGLAVKFNNACAPLSRDWQLPSSAGPLGGTVCFLAPEVFLETESHLSGNPEAETRRSRRLDVYAYGITMWQVLVGGRWPYESEYAAISDAMIMKWVTDGRRPEIPPIRDILPTTEPAHYGRYRLEDVVLPLMKRCWSQSPEDRPMFSEVKDALSKLAEDTAMEAAEDAVEVEKIWRQRSAGGSELVQESGQVAQPQSSEGASVLPRDHQEASWGASVTTTPQQPESFMSDSTPLHKLSRDIELLNMKTYIDTDEEFRRSLAQFQIPPDWIPAPVAECNVANNKASISGLHLTEHVGAETRLKGAESRLEGEESEKDAGKDEQVTSPGRASTGCCGDFHLPRPSMAVPSINTYIPDELGAVSEECVAALAPHLVKHYTRFFTELKMTETELSLIKERADSDEEAVVLAFATWRRRYGDKAIRKWVLAALVYLGLTTPHIDVMQKH